MAATMKQTPLQYEIASDEELEAGLAEPGLKGAQDQACRTGTDSFAQIQALDRTHTASFMTSLQSSSADLIIHCIVVQSLKCTQSGAALASRCCQRSSASGLSAMTRPA
jgi:hypothetical protein